MHSIDSMLPEQPIAIEFPSGGGLPCEPLNMAEFSKPHMTRVQCLRQPIEIHACDLHVKTHTFHHPKLGLASNSSLKIIVFRLLQQLKIARFPRISLRKSLEKSPKLAPGLAAAFLRPRCARRG